MKVVYADPPYIGQSRKHYKDHPDYAGEVDHGELIERLEADYDGWALSCSGRSLQTILGLCSEGVRVGAWFKPWSNMLPGIRVQYSWEPVVFRPARTGPHVKGDPLLRDWVLANPEGFTFRQIEQGAVIGRKPERFCFWLFNVLGLHPDDEFVDLFPGNGAVTRAWEAWAEQGTPRLRQTVKATDELLEAS